MNVNDIITIIQSVGFPIVVVFVLLYGVKWFLETFFKPLLNSNNETLQILTEVKTSINNQTELLKILLEKEKKENEL